MCQTDEMVGRPHRIVLASSARLTIVRQDSNGLWHMKVGVLVSPMHEVHGPWCPLAACWLVEFLTDVREAFACAAPWACAAGLARNDGELDSMRLGRTIGGSQ